MAVIRENAAASIAEWRATRPPKIQAMIDSHPPDRLYRIKETGHRCTIYSYSENNTVTVSVTGEFNLVTFSRHVFGINLESLEECDLPDPNEELGDRAAQAGYTEDDIKNILIPKLKELNHG